MSDIERGNQSHVDNVNFKSRAQKSYDEKKHRLELYKAALSNDWKKAKTIYEEAKMEYGVRITKRGETALHIAALAGHTEFVQNLVQKMSPEEIRIETRDAKWDETRNGGNTAFHCAVISGNVKIAKAIMKRENLHDLAMAKGVGNYLPIYMATRKGNEEMVRFLYDFAYKNHLQALSCRDNGDGDEDRRSLFLSLIKSNVHDVALQMAKALFPRHIAPKEMEEEALEELALIPLNPPRFLHRCIHSILRRQTNVVIQENAVELVELLWDSLTLNKQRFSAFINSPDPNPIMEAAKRGNYNFLSILIATYPDILFVYDHNKYTIIHYATLNRHVDIFKFIHIGSAKTIVTMYRDHEGNNMLHLAAKLAPANRLDIVPGAALQLQRELLWFEEVKKVMEPQEVHRKKYHSSHFPLDTMLSLIKEMKTKMDKLTFTEGLFEKLKKVLNQQSRELKEYHSSYKGLSKRYSSRFTNDNGMEDMEMPMNQSDVVLLYKKLKKAVEQEYDELDITYHWEMVKVLETIGTEIMDIAKRGQSDDHLVLKEFVNKEMERCDELTNYIVNQNLLDLFQQLNEWMDRYESQQCDISQLHEEVKKVVLKRPQRSRPSNTQIERLRCLFEDIYQTIFERDLDTNLFVQTLKNVMEKYKDLEEYPPRRTQIPRELLQVYQDTDDLKDGYLRNRDGELISELLKDKLKVMKFRSEYHQLNEVTYQLDEVIKLFKEMNEVMEQHELNQNKKLTEEYTPHDVFVKEHENLMEKGEKWMRDTANSCMIVAVLITTIAFAAAITVPGGNGDDGYPNFSSETLFRAFAIADSISMISSTTSLLNFLSILTARFSIDDFHWSLPNKLFIGLLTIFVSIVAMMVAFVLSIFIIFNSSSPPLFSILIAAASFVPIVLFLWQHSGLSVDVFRSTYASYFLFKPRIDPSSVFKRISSSGVELEKTS